MVEIATVAMLVAAYAVLVALSQFGPRGAEAVPLLSYAAVAWLFGVGFWTGAAGLVIGSVVALPVRYALRGV